MKKILLLIFIFLLTSCTKYTELNNLAIIKSIGIKHDNNYTLYAEIIEEIDKDNKPKTKIIEIEAINIKELFTNIKLLINKEIYFSHIDLLILDENIKKDDLRNIINYFLNHQEFRNDFLTIMTDDIKKVLENSKYDEVEQLITNNKNSKKIIKISFEELVSKFLNNKVFYLSKIIYDNEIKIDANYQFINNFERINNEEN